MADRPGPSRRQIQLISGHASRKSLEGVYQHLDLADVQGGYQRAVRGTMRTGRRIKEELEKKPA